MSVGLPFKCSDNFYNLGDACSIQFITESVEMAARGEKSVASSTSNSTSSRNFSDDDSNVLSTPHRPERSIIRVFITNDQLVDTAGNLWFAGIAMSKYLKAMARIYNNTQLWAACHLDIL